MKSAESAGDHTRPRKFSGATSRLLAFGNQQVRSATGKVLIGKVRDVDNLFFSVNGQGFSNNFTVGQRDGNRFVTPGDSGSILALKAEVGGKPAFVAIGVLFAQLDDSGKIGLACNMSQFLDALKPDLPGGQKISSWQFPTV